MIFIGFALSESVLLVAGPPRRICGDRGMHEGAPDLGDQVIGERWTSSGDHRVATKVCERTAMEWHKLCHVS